MIDSWPAGGRKPRSLGLPFRLGEPSHPIRAAASRPRHRPSTLPLTLPLTARRPNTTAPHLTTTTTTAPHQFYVNRGQGITSYGMDNKDAPMMEFETASKAYQTSDISGFRTLLKVLCCCMCAQTISPH